MGCLTFDPCKKKKKNQSLQNLYFKKVYDPTLLMNCPIYIYMANDDDVKLATCHPSGIHMPIKSFYIFKNQIIYFLYLKNQLILINYKIKKVKQHIRGKILIKFPSNFFLPLK